MLVHPLCWTPYQIYQDQIHQIPAGLSGLLSPIRPMVCRKNHGTSNRPPFFYPTMMVCSADGSPPENGSEKANDGFVVPRFRPEMA